MRKIFGYLYSDFLKIEAAGGVLLLVFAVIALLWSNSPFADAYFEGVRHPFVFGEHAHSLVEIFNDTVMVIFFLNVGLEIKRELLIGELSTRKKALLPIIAACGGAALPAMIYFCLNPSGPAVSGWGIPMATDIAFAVSALAMLGTRIPAPVKIFLLALAIADDLIAVLVIACFYTEHLSWQWLLVGGLVFVLIDVLRRRGVTSYIPYIALGICAWFAIYRSGVHATVAGVILGLQTPLSVKGSSRKPLEKIGGILHPWVSFVIMPFFAFFNAGVDMRGLAGFAMIQDPVFLGIFLGLSIGKPVGVLLSARLAVLMGLAEKIRGVSWMQFLSLGFLAGIGFTMALFVQELGLKDERLHAFAKSAILCASLFSAILGCAWALLFFPRPKNAKAHSQ